MSIANYTDLVAAVGDWLDRDDLATRASTFVQLAEARMNRLLDDPEMEVTATVTADDDYTTLPEDFGSMVSLSVGGGPLSAYSASEFAGFNQVSGTPRGYAIIDGSLTFAPGNRTANITMVYRRRIPALSTEYPTNWLLTLAPDAYLYGALVQAEGFLAEDDRVGGWKAAFEEAIAELRIDATKRKWGAGPIAPRINRP